MRYHRFIVSHTNFVLLIPPLAIGLLIILPFYLLLSPIILLMKYFDSRV